MSGGDRCEVCSVTREDPFVCGDCIDRLVARRAREMRIALEKIIADTSTHSLFDGPDVVLLRVLDIARAGLAQKEAS